MKEEHDEKTGYCRKLGHHLPFKYCRTQDAACLCPKIRDCWFEKFDVNTFLESNYTPEELSALDAPPAPKAVTLLELIEKAKKARDADSPSS